MTSHKKSPFSLALITGASSGIGEALCRLLASKGINLMITGRNKEQLEDLAAQLRGKVEVTVFTAELTNPVDRQRVIAHIREQCPDLIINNAGFGLYGDALSYPTQAQLDILTVNGNVALEFTLEAARTLQSKQKKGVILNVASAAAFYTFPQFAVYAAAKDFILNASLSIDTETRPHGVRVLAACPGMVDTDFSHRASGKIQPKNKLAMSADAAAEHIWWQIEKRKPYYIFDWKTRWGTYLSRLVPQSLVSRILAKNVISRTK